MSRFTTPAKTRPDFPATSADKADEADLADLATKRAYTSVASHGVSKPAGVPNSVFDAGKLAKPPKPARKPTALIDLSALVIETGVPLPTNTRREATRTYDILLARLVPGSSVLLTANQAKYLLSAAKKRGINATTRFLGDGRARFYCLAPATAAGIATTAATATTATTGTTSATGAKA